MANRVRKPDLPSPASRVHKDKQLPDDLLRFSFRHFELNEKFCYPEEARMPTYFPALLDRLKLLSGMRLSDFRANGGHRSIRAHRHAWPNTTEPTGYAHLTEQLRECEPWQFALSVNEHGRVHGVLIDDVFYVVWLDCDHKLYP